MIHLKNKSYILHGKKENPLPEALQQLLAFLMNPGWNSRDISDGWTGRL